MRPGIAALVLLVVLGAGLAAGLAELGLRVAGFRFVTFPVVQFGWPQPQEIQDAFVPDRELFWVTPDYAAKVKAAKRSHPALVFMGDSCTQWGTWPQLTLAQLAAREPELSKGVSLAVAGWSSEQGVRQLPRDVLPLRPKLITVYYGWNDHWLAFGEPDPDIHASAASYWLTTHLRLMQLFVKARMSRRDTTGAAGGVRVPLDRYRANLETIGRLARASGSRVMFLTAPSGHEAGHEPEYLARRHVRDLKDLIPLHQQYVAATREAATSAGVELCDLARAFEQLPAPRGQYFTHDGIHLNDRGSASLAAQLTACIAAGAGTMPRENISRVKEPQ